MISTDPITDCLEIPGRFNGPPGTAHGGFACGAIARYVDGPAEVSLRSPPPLPGVEELWGRSVFHCPFCDGWEVRDRPLAVHGSGAEAARSALVVSGWSSDVVLYTDGPARLNGERAALERAGVRIREEPVRALAGRDGRLQRIAFESGPDERRDALFVRTRRDQPNGLATALGCRLTLGGTIATDCDGRTEVPGVYAAGDAATERLRSVANAIGSGSRVAHAVALDLVTEIA